MSVAVVNIGRSHSGDLVGTPLPGDALVCDGGVIAWIGSSADVARGDHESVLDAGGAGVIPGLIDSHVHVTFGDYTPRQQTVGYLESYLHGGMTRAITASEVHTPGRPSDPAGVKALAVAAQRCFADFRPGGVTVHAGSVILEPGLTRVDFEELWEQGVWLAKAGFGAFDGPLDYVPVAQAARAAGLLVTCHTGGGSIPGSLDRIDAGAVIAMGAHVSFHVNGGPTAMTPEDNEKIVVEGGEVALQLAMAGNLRSALDICRLAREHQRTDRLLISTDTPTGTGVVPLGMFHLIAELVSLGGLPVELAIAAATGSVGRVYGLDAGILAPGRPADLLILDAPLGSAGEDWAGALQAGDLPGIGAALTAGHVRYTKSRNTPAPKRPVAVV
ncbi:amidohydrolase family protein [Conexibacter stalactiti]|uniref:Amidohydrolase family protein n=1 Tax=Conexibacter stalactiti TaxID=1940611 RepID=A0ABU4HWP4_9ACTN|nr:amidohydrolase family protein [Conexibacter stalactiti]MDW5597097.1 amidohydrolase family protein [Conexibacter stalactiti]MEC5037739.1 amidohydrolase family protein [Conexibacter stalactiti]